MPTFPDVSVRAVSERPAGSGPGQEHTHKTSLKTSHGQNYVIRSRPTGIYGPYKLCAFIKRSNLVFKANCVTLHTVKRKELPGRKIEKKVHEVAINFYLYF